MRITKYKLMMISFLILTLVLFQQGEKYAMTEELSLFDKVIYIDAGHGGRDPGTMYGNLYEKDINLAITKILETELGKKGAIVYQIRTKDEDLSSPWDSKKKRADLYRRIQKIEEAKSDIYLSIHINWYKQSHWNGAEVLYSPVNPNNKILADEIMKQFEIQLKSPRHVSTTDLYMYENTKVPGVLVECGYLSNPNERELLQQEKYQRKVSLAIVKGVENYFKQVQKA